MTLKEYKQRRLISYLEAEQAILSGQSYTLEGRSLTRADLATVRAVIEDLFAEGITPEGTDEPVRRTTRVVFE